MQLIDVRTVGEVEENGRIESEGQLLIPIEEFIERMDEWPADKIRKSSSTVAPATARPLP
jgi:hypothetical protein